MYWSQSEIDACIEECRQKATVDAEFRALLLSDVATAVKMLTGKDIPEGLKIKIVDCDPVYNATFILPPLASNSVSDDELDEIAGGYSQCGMDACSANKNLK